ncbi:hypothetical protein TNCV_4014591 [Trichonephila clavipes]|uniref:Uncharacterized protein n=1 Tax=Trichonephila clavipes TaxID=2585209 RepID=A0A8X6RLY7_TRICX|nr:hypothetical protein TNCV_4014591 [Trichonephila clavipes]
MIFHSCLLGKRSVDLANQRNTLTPYRAFWVATGYNGERYPVGKYHLNDVYELKCNSLNRQTPQQVALQYINFCTVQSIAKLPDEIAKNDAILALSPSFRYATIESSL